MSSSKRILGIDYGSKIAGTTVVAHLSDGQIVFSASEKGRNADAMILALAEELKPTLIAIDAPLSLPGVYRGLVGCDDYFYRDCDRLTKAMSPMFLGGLTARAMKLSAQLRASGVKVIEVYPVKTGRGLGLKAFGYREKRPELAGLFDQFYSETGIDLREQAGLTGHHIDAAIALYIASQYDLGEANQMGNLSEGIIYY